MKVLKQDSIRNREKIKDEKNNSKHYYTIKKNAKRTKYKRLKLMLRRFSFTGA